MQAAPQPIQVTILRTEWEEPTKEAVRDMIDSFMRAETPEQEYKAALEAKHTLKLIHEPWNYYVKCGAKKNTKNDVFYGIAWRAKVLFVKTDLKSKTLHRFIMIGDEKKRNAMLERMKRKMVEEEESSA